MLSVVGNVAVHSEAPMMTSSISRFASPTRFFGGAHRGRVCVCVHRAECTLMFVNVYVCNWISQKKKCVPISD